MNASEPQIVLDGTYRLEDRLGEGANGVVYRALHLGLKKTFAVKLLQEGSLDPGSLARFRREAEALGQLRHPHVVEVTDFGIDAAAGGVPYLVMELLEGSTLAEVCHEQGPLSLDRALPLLEAIAAAIDAAHGCGVLHRDLKPGNVLLCPVPGGEPLVKVLDFGLAEIVENGSAPPGGELPADGRLTATGALLGTPLYAAPELIRQETASPASDIYSFGVIAYELLAGHPPFRGSTREVLAGHLDADPPAPAPQGEPLPREVWEALREPLRKDPAARPATTGEVVRRIHRAGQWAARRRWWAAELPRRAGLAVLLTALLLLAGLLPTWPFLVQIDHRVQDLRVRWAPSRPPDPRILLLTLDEASLAEGVPLDERADEIGSTLSRVLAAGARGVAIDLLLPARWSEAPEFSDLVLRHRDRVTLAAASDPGGRVVGTDCLAGLTATALGPEAASALFGYVNLEEEEDGVTRTGRLRFRDRDGTLRPTWAAHAARGLETPEEVSPNRFWIDGRIDGTRFARISWRDVPATLDRRPELFQDRLVLVGGDFPEDLHRVPHRSGTLRVSGLTLQALLVETIATGLPVREPPRTPFVIVLSLLLGLALAGVLCAPRARPAVLVICASALVVVALSFLAFCWQGWVLPVALPGLLVLSGVGLVLALRRWLPPAPEVSR